MELTPAEVSTLHGDDGPVKQKAMEILAALGEIFEADRLIEVGSVQISGVSYKTIGEAGLQWIESMSSERAVVPTTLNPTGMDLHLWKQMGISDEFAEKQLQIIKAYIRLGAKTLCSCTPYLSGHSPKLKDHIAWSESSAVCYANSVLGARTNREGGPSALAAALIGETPNYGYHLDENRQPTLHVDVDVPLHEESDFGAMGASIGRMVNNGVPYFTGVKGPSADGLKSLAAALAASGGVAMYHMEGVTPEAASVELDGVEKVVFTSEDLASSYGELSTFQSGEVDVVAIGCPHASLSEMRKVAGLIKGKKVAENTKLWVFTSVGAKLMAERFGYLGDIVKAGGKVYTDCCMVVAPVEEFGFKTMAVNSAKAAIYGPSASKVGVIFGTTGRCVDIAVKGYA
ncbi:MAG: aconitase X [Nitrososphaerales archaeon]